MSISPIVPVILCGGSGTRLWPLSRSSFPKQYLSLNSFNKKSLLQETKERIDSISNLSNPILICNEEHRFIVAEQMRLIDTKPYSIILEPFGRNTAPAITLGAIKALEKEIDPLILVLSSDHEIKDEKEFLKAIEKAIKYAEKGELVNFGVLPTKAETGYGYIKAESPFIDGENHGKKIIKFTEKPDYPTALELIKDKSFTWNSGIFMFKATSILNEINKFAPKILEFCKGSIENSSLDLDFQRLDRNTFSNCPNISIDIAVMEKTSKGTVVPLNAGWNDIGSWEALWETSKKDENKNFTKGQIITQDTKNCYLRGESRLIVGIGLEDLIVIETNDSILISKKDQTQKVKDIVKHLKANNMKEAEMHNKIFRPWGNYLSVAKDERWQVKLITINPNEKISLQLHKYRSEHWVVVKGTAKVEVEETTLFLKENQSIYIPQRSKHRLSNPGKKILQIIEIQSGSYIGEDDIVRFEDKYGRINEYEQS